MEITDIKRLEQPKIQHHNSSTDSQQSGPESPSLEMTVVLNEKNPYWANDAPLRCASNADMSPGRKTRRDFKFQVIHLNAGPRWFIFPSNKAERAIEFTELPQATNGSSDQENQRDNSNVRRSMRYMSRRKISNELIKANTPDVDMFEDNLCKATATNQRTDAPMSEPTTRRINSKPICQSPIDCRFKVTKASLSLSPPSTSSDCSNFSNQSTLSFQSDTFQILSVVKNSDDEDDETVETIETIEEQILMAKNTSKTTISISNVDGKSHV